MKKPPYSAAPFLPDHPSLKSLREAVQGCEGCPLYKFATQAVPGEGRAHPRIVLVGEQPGNEEDLSGHPFVGPAGKILDRVLEAAGIDRDETYVTNAVKHFKFVGRGKRRIHQKPSTAEVGACRDWLEAELRLLKPEILVCMGATAALSVFGKAMPVLANRQKWFETQWCAHTMITVHPSSILRVPDRDVRDQAIESMVEDFVFARKLKPSRADGHRSAAKEDHSASLATAAELLRRRNHSYERFSRR